ncbi:MAG: hypothetical protein GKC53_06525 [Neisseriaceae bacterium]|nr:MAG: hypothetical protein GKC53_06525 [Neisseriaceae bacterium]
MSQFIKNSISTIFLFIVFLIFVIALIIFVLANNISDYNSSYLIYLDILYCAGVIPLFFSFWLVFSEKSKGDWKYGILAFILFIFLLYYHCLCLYDVLTSVDYSKYLLMLDELILLYVMLSLAVALSIGLQNDGKIDEESNIEIFKLRFKYLLTFFLVSLFLFYFYETFRDYTGLNLVTTDLLTQNFIYVNLLESLLNSGLLPLVFTFWLMYSRLVKGGVYYYITLIFVLVFIYIFQMFFIVSYYHSYLDNKLGYWILEGIELVMVYIAMILSCVFSVESADSIQEK